MIRTGFAKPALVVLGFATLVGVYNSVQRNRTNAYAVTPAAFRQFDSSAQNVDAPRPDSPDAEYASMAQSGDGAVAGQAGQGQVGQAAPSHANDTFIGYDDTRSIRGDSQQNGRSGQYGQASQYGQAPQYGRAGQYAPTTYGSERSSAPSPAGGWTQLVSPDGSATLALPANWRIAGGAKGAVGVEGPSNEQVVLGLQSFVTPNQAPYMGPEQALAWFMRTHGVQLLGIQQHEAQQARSGQAELVIGESELQGRKYKFVARVTTAQIGMGNWMLQVSSMGAPVEQFDADFPTMQKIWNSWNLDPNYVRNAFQTAATMNQQTATMMANGAMARFNGWKPFNESFDQTLRGVSTVENQTMGTRGEVQLGTEQQYLNNCARNGQDCRQVPMNELVPQQ